MTIGRVDRVAWLTDLHLNFISQREIVDFVQRVAREEPAAVLISGDIGESHDIAKHLDTFQTHLKCPIYFVLGNHDYYFGKIHEVRRNVRGYCNHFPKLRYLTSGESYPLTPTIGIVGHDGWGDARLGDYDNSLIMLNDFGLIHDLKGLSTSDRKRMLGMLGDMAAQHFRKVLPAALRQWRHVFAVTHVPPWREACWHVGGQSGEDWLPFFSCKAVGDALVEIMQQHPHQQLTVVCGHTHSGGESDILPNLKVYTGRAEYGAPEIQRIFELTA
jgi:3',5'-cyclic-AMP phosphodiesterase